MTSVRNVFVRPEQRRRGLGAAITAVARSGTSNAVACLEASAMGEPVYRRMGFETKFHYVTLAPRAERVTGALK